MTGPLRWVECWTLGPCSATFSDTSLTHKTWGECNNIVVEVVGTAFVSVWSEMEVVANARSMTVPHCSPPAAESEFKTETCPLTLIMTHHGGRQPSGSLTWLLACRNTPSCMHAAAQLPILDLQGPGPACEAATVTLT